MGATLHVIAEYLSDENRWIPTACQNVEVLQTNDQIVCSEAFIWRDYYVFNTLAGIRPEENKAKLIAPVRGLPPYLHQWARNTFNREKYHHLSWLLFSEIHLRASNDAEFDASHFMKWIRYVQEPHINTRNQRVVFGFDN